MDQTQADSAEFERILRDTQDRVRAYIAGLGAGRDEVDDLAQDVYVAFHRGWSKMPPDIEPIRWLKGIARNVCMNHFRRTKREKAHQFEAIADLLSQSAAATDDTPGFEAAFDRLRDCLAAVSEKGRKLLALKYEQNLNSKEIARKTSMNPSAIRMTLLRVRDSLYRCLTRATEEAAGLA